MPGSSDQKARGASEQSSRISGDRWLLAGLAISAIVPLAGALRSWNEGERDWALPQLLSALVLAALALWVQQRRRQMQATGGWEVDLRTIRQPAARLDLEERICDCNETWVELTGRTREHSMGSRLEELGLSARYTEGASPSGELWMRPDGVTRVVHLQRVRSGGGGTLVLAMDGTAQKKADLALRRSIELVRALAEGCREGVVCLDFEEQRHVISARFKALLGYGAEALSDTPETLVSLLSPDDLNWWQEVTGRGLPGMTTRNRSAFLRKADGSLLNLDLQCVVLRHASGGCVAVILFAADLESQRKTLESLRRLERTVENSGLVVFQRGAGLHEPVVHVSANITRYGYQVEDFTLRGQLWEELVLEEDRAGFVAQLESDRMQGVQLARHEYRLRAKSGHVFWVEEHVVALRDASGFVVGLSGYVEDVSARRLLEAELQRERALLRDLSERMPGTIFQLQMLSGGRFRVHYLSPSVERVWRMPTEKVRRLMEDGMRFIEREDRARTYAALCRAAERQQSCCLRYRLTEEFGRDVYLETVAQPHRELDGRVVFTGFTYMPGEESKPERRLVRPTDNGRSGAEFLAATSQRLRLPLQAAIGQSQMLLTSGGSLEGRAGMERFLESVREVHRRLGDLQDYSDLVAGKLVFRSAAFEPAAEVKALAESLRARAQARRLGWLVDVEQAMGHFVNGDAGRFRQVVEPLLRNAVQHTVPGGVSIRLQASREGGAAGSVRLRLEVEDGGPGMSADRLGLLLGSTDAPVWPSTALSGGLGLALSSRLARLMGGSLQGRSAPGCGSCFSFEVVLEGGAAPLSRETPPLHADPAGQSTAAPAHARCLVAVVDDNPVARNVAKAFLRAAEADCELFDSGGAFLAAIEAGKDYAAVFMDIRMPVMDGLETTRLLLESCSRLGRTAPFVAGFTADIMPELKQRAIEAGMCHVLAKPAQMAEVRRTLEMALRRRQQAGEG